MIINGEVPEHRANKDFLRMLDTNNPRYTGWPVWLNSEGFSEEENHPFVHEHIWEAFLVRLQGYYMDHIDFYRIDPSGRFFIKRAYEDDIGGSDKKPAPLQQLDFGITILRVAETLAVGLVFAKAMECNPEETSLFYRFEWDKLKGRELSSWADWNRYISGGRKAYQDKAISSVEVPLDTPLSRLGEYVKNVIDPLFEVFNGFEIGQNVVDDLTNKLINRRL